MIALICGLFGLIIGSFLNVVVLRRGAGALTGRSVCMSCGRQLGISDMVPVLSWVLLRGKCRQCGSRISIQYPLVELSTAIAFALFGGAYFAGILQSVTPVQLLLLSILYFVILALLIAIAAYDILHTIIPDGWVWIFNALALLLLFLPHPVPHVFYLLAAGPIAAAPFFLLWFVSSGRWMGLGDAKLALGLGWLLGFPTGLVAGLSAFVLGSLVMVPLLVLGRVTHSTSFPLGRLGLTMKSEVPFGPFIIASALLFWFAALYGLDPIRTYLTLWS